MSCQSEHITKIQKSGDKVWIIFGCGSSFFRFAKKFKFALRLSRIVQNTAAKRRTSVGPV